MFLGHFIEYALLRGSVGTLFVWGQGCFPVTGNNFRAFQRAKMSPQDT